MNNEHKIILFTSFAHFFAHVYELTFPALAIPLMLSLNLSLAEVFKLSFLMYLLLGLGALPWGMISDRYGNRKILTIFFIGSGMGSLLTALSQSSNAMTFALAVIGFFVSIYHPVGLSLISRGVKNRGMALGINGAAGSIGIAMAPFMAGLLNWLAGWQMIYFILGVLSIGTGIAMTLVKLDETPVHQEDLTATSQDNRSNLKAFVILCLVSTLGGLVYRMNTVVLPAYLEFKADFLWSFFQSMEITRTEGLTTVAATLLASLIYIVGIFGQVAGGKMADRYDLPWVYFAFYGLSMPFLILMASLNNEALVVSAGIYIFFALGMQPAENSLVARITPGRWRSTSYGIKFILFFGIGSLAVYLAGWIQSVWNLSAVYLVSAGVVFMMLIAIAVLIRSTRQVVCRNVSVL
jgi:MFS family permease